MDKPLRNWYVMSLFCGYPTSVLLLLFFFFYIDFLVLLFVHFLILLLLLLLTFWFCFFINKYTDVSIHSLSNFSVLLFGFSAFRNPCCISPFDALVELSISRQHTYHKHRIQFISFGSFSSSHQLKSRTNVLHFEWSLVSLYFKGHKSCVRRWKLQIYIYTNIYNSLLAYIKNDRRIHKRGCAD